MSRHVWSVVAAVVMAFLALGSVPAPRGWPAGGGAVEQPQPTTPIPSYRELAKSRKGDRTFRNFVVSDPISREELIALAENVHRLYPNDAARFFDDDKEFGQFAEWDANYPDKRYPYPKEWAAKHYLALMNRMGAQGGPRWELSATDGGDRFIRNGDTTLAVIK